MERVLPPLTHSHLKVFFRAKLWLFLQVYIAIPLIFMYGFKFAFPQFDSAFFVTGFVANTAFMCAYFPSAFDGFNRIFTLRQYEAYWAATLPLWRMMVEDIAWYALRGSVAALTCGLVGYVTSDPGQVALVVLMFPVVFLISLHAAVFGVMCASLSKSFDDITYFETLISLMFVFSGVFVSVSTLPDHLQWLAMAFPLFHGIELVRWLGGLHVMEPMMGLLHAAVLVASTVLCFVVAHWRLKARLFV